MNPGIFRFKKKDVDVFICNDLKPALQCSKAAKKANQTLGRITRSFSKRDENIWLKLYKVYVRPMLEHAVQAWIPWMIKGQRYSFTGSSAKESNTKDIYSQGKLI